MKPKEARQRKAASRAAAQAHAPQAAAKVQADWRLPRWYYAAAIAGFLLVVFQVYGPALHGPFLFDDIYLPMSVPNPPVAWYEWMSGVRPMLALSFWANWRESDGDTLSYHALNVIFHLLNSVLVFLIVRKLLALARRSEGSTRAAASELFAAFAAGLFLLHPAQTESVAYIASRSENQSALFYFGAFAVFLYRREQAVSWSRAAVILALFAGAVFTKEHTITLPALLLLTDYFWNPGFTFEGVRRNWRLYAPIAAGAVGGTLVIFRLVRGAESAGFGLKDLSWYEYFFTQCRAVFVYFRLFLFPTGQTIDYDFPISRTVFEHGAIIGLIVLLAIAGAALYFRRRYPLAAYGLLVFFILLAPTSSILPIKDPVAERRLYLPMIGLLLVLLEFLPRLRWRKPGLAAGLAVILVAAAGASYARNRVWSSAEALWKDAVAKTPDRARVRFQLAYAYFAMGRCGEAVQQYEKVAALERPDYRLLVDWALAYDCMGRPGEAQQRLAQAAGMEPTAHVYALIGMVQAKQGHVTQASEALDRAEKLDPNFDMTYVYRGNLLLQRGDSAAAAHQYRRALAINPRNQAAIQALSLVERR